MSCWILQCNINDYRWLDSMILHRNGLDTWGIDRRYTNIINEIEEGDTAFIWLTQYKREETRGIFAVAEIRGLPDEKRMDFAWANLYWVDQEARERHLKKFNLELQYTKLIIDKPILKDELEKAGLSIAKRMPEASIRRVTNEECGILKKMVEARCKGKIEDSWYCR